MLKWLLQNLVHTFVFLHAHDSLKVIEQGENPNRGAVHAVGPGSISVMDHVVVFHAPVSPCFKMSHTEVDLEGQSTWTSPLPRGQSYPSLSGHQ